MQRYDRTDIVGFAGETIVPPGVEQTSAEARDVEVSGVEDRVLVRCVVGIGLENDNAGERTVLGVALGRELNLTTGYSIPVRVVVTADVRADVDLETDVTFDLKAGFRARDVEVAGAVGVADANVFNRFRLGSDDCVCCECRCSDEGSCGTKQHHTNVHGKPIS